MLAEGSRTALQCIELDQEKAQKHASKNEGILKRMLKYASLLPMPTVKESAPPGATVTAKQMSLLFAVILYLSSANPITDQQRLISDLFIMLFTDGSVTILRCPGCLRIGKTVKLALVEPDAHSPTGPHATRNNTQEAPTTKIGSSE
ncbi:MAG: hypothetical protein KVP17_004859 [Porospora cf. gigantea B]|uniref:uncharacterized protein n=1 Tax=Porospora cf. gigantea B TaxID=2853592 RepID=UPI00357194D4|nr:MAG: hypothetical protein KVP17_004859 [Porospora cf. gigantea B]